MAIPTVPVTCVIADQWANPLVGVSVTMILNAPDTYEGFVVQTTVTEYTDETGTCILNVFPNALGSNSTQYKVTIQTPEKTVKGLATVPNGACDLWSIMNLVAPPALSLAAAAQAAAMNSQIASEASQQAAALSQAAAAMSALSAAQLAFNAATSSANSQAMATLAATYGQSLGGTSASSLTIGTGLQSVVTQPNKQWLTGQWIILVEASNPLNWMAGPVVSYDGISALVMNAQQTNGSGTHYDWGINLSGPQGPQGNTGPTGSLAMMQLTALALGGI
jgi:nitrogen fixation protein FixH